MQGAVIETARPSRGLYRLHVNFSRSSSSGKVPMLYLFRMWTREVLVGKEYEAGKKKQPCTDAGVTSRLWAAVGSIPLHSVELVLWNHSSPQLPGGNS